MKKKLSILIAINRLFLFLMMGSLSMGIVSSCGNKVAQQAAAEQAKKIAKAKSDLQVLLNNTTMPVDEKERRLQQIKNLNLNDSEVNSLIAQVEKQIADEKARIAAEEEAKRKAAEEAKRKAEEAKVTEEKKLTIYDYFTQIAAAGGAKNVDLANQKISEALKLFTSPDADVLRIVYQNGDQKDYDEPTTIKKYLEYLKDVGKELEKIEVIEYDDNKKIKLLEVKKK